MEWLFTNFGQRILKELLSILDCDKDHFVIQLISIVIYKGVHTCDLKIICLIAYHPN